MINLCADKLTSEGKDFKDEKTSKGEKWLTTPIYSD